MTKSPAAEGGDTASMILDMASGGCKAAASTASVPCATSNRDLLRDHRMRLRGSSRTHTNDHSRAELVVAQAGRVAQNAQSLRLPDASTIAGARQRARDRQRCVRHRSASWVIMGEVLSC